MRRFVFFPWVFFVLASIFTASAAVDDRTVCRDRSNAEAAIAACTRLIESGETKGSNLAYLYNERGLGWYAQREHDRAVADFDQAIRLNPNYVLAYSNRGNALRRKGEYDSAVVDYDQAIRLNRNFAIAYSGRGNVRWDKGDYDRAIADYSQAIRLDPSFTGAYTSRGLAYERKNDIEHARADFNAALAVPQKYENGKWAHDTARERLAALPPIEPMAQSNDIAAKAAGTVDMHIETVVRRLGICADIDPTNAAVYLLISGEYIRDKVVGDAVVKTEKLMETELRRIGIDAAGIEKAKVARNQALDMLDQETRKLAKADPPQVVRSCRIMAHNFQVRQGVFAPLAKRFPLEMRALDEWR